MPILYPVVDVPNVRLAKRVFGLLRRVGWGVLADGTRDPEKWGWVTGVKVTQANKRRPDFDFQHPSWNLALDEWNRIMSGGAADGCPEAIIYRDQVESFLRENDLPSDGSGE